MMPLPLLFGILFSGAASDKQATVGQVVTQIGVVAGGVAIMIVGVVLFVASTKAGKTVTNVIETVGKVATVA